MSASFGNFVLGQLLLAARRAGGRCDSCGHRNVWHRPACGVAGCGCQG